MISSLIEEPFTKYERLEDRLIDFAVDIVDFTNAQKVKIGHQHLMKQLTRSVSAPALNYAEAQNAESKRDFIHKMSICLKELQETQVCLKILDRSNTFHSDVDSLYNECSQLVAIFTTSIKTAKARSLK